MLLTLCYLQILIRWAIQNGTSVIPKATGESHIRGNLEALDIQLSKEEMGVNALTLSIVMLLYLSGICTKYDVLERYVHAHMLLQVSHNYMLSIRTALYFIGSTQLSCGSSSVLVLDLAVLECAVALQRHALQDLPDRTHRGHLLWHDVCLFN